MREEKSKLEASNIVKDNQIASLEAKLKRAREKHEAETTKLMQESTKVAINLSSAKVKIDELRYEVNHVRGLNEN
jgi:predicted  nucleic acid-binding Zn-ribbon protein